MTLMSDTNVADHFIKDRAGAELQGTTLETSFTSMLPAKEWNAQFAMGS